MCIKVFLLPCASCLVSYPLMSHDTIRTGNTPLEQSGFKHSTQEHSDEGNKI